jgi:hypothetical protein
MVEEIQGNYICNWVLNAIVRKLFSKFSISIGIVSVIGYVVFRYYASKKARRIKPKRSAIRDGQLCMAKKKREEIDEV